MNNPDGLQNEEQTTIEVHDDTESSSEEPEEPADWKDIDEWLNNEIRILLSKEYLKNSTLRQQTAELQNEKQITDEVKEPDAKPDEWLNRKFRISMIINRSDHDDFKTKIKKNYFESSKKRDAEQYEKWLLSVRATMGALKKSPLNLSIYKVPEKLKILNEDAYNPRIVSIGPLHQHNQRLLPMEEHKWRYMLNFLRRARKDDQRASVIASHECANVIVECEKEARACYAENIDLDKYQLAEVLLVDGCFILELFIKHAEMSRGSQSFDDPIISNSWMVPTLEHDLALLENQIPFFVLEKLFDTVIKNSPEYFPLIKYALLFFSSALNLSENAVRRRVHSTNHRCICNNHRYTCNNHRCTYKHITDMLYQVYSYKQDNITEMVSEDVQDNNVPPFVGFERCARQLYKRGIRFEVGDKSDNNLEIKYEGKGVLKIPKLCINESTEYIFRNLIAFEQCSSHGTNYIASYAFLMKSLVRSSQDVDLLMEKKIIIKKKEGAIYNQKKKAKLAAARADKTSTLFKNLCKEVVCYNKDFYFKDLCSDVNKYHKSWRHWSRIRGWTKVKWIEWSWILKNEYFRSPWSIIAFIAAFLLFIFTFLQTFWF